MYSLEMCITTIFIMAASEKCDRKLDNNIKLTLAKQTSTQEHFQYMHGICYKHILNILKSNMNAKTRGLDPMKTSV